MIVLWCILYHVLVAYNTFSIRRNGSTICEKVCVFAYIPTRSLVQKHGVPDQNTVKRQLNQGREMFFSGYFVLNVKALSLCFLYTVIKRENRLRLESFSAVRCLNECCEILNKVSIMCFAFPKIISLRSNFPCKQRMLDEQACSDFPSWSPLLTGRFQRLNSLQMKYKHE